jgi:hypothetical protein
MADEMAIISAMLSKSIKRLALGGLGPIRDPLIPGQWPSRSRCNISHANARDAGHQNPRSANEKDITLPES